MLRRKKTRTRNRRVLIANHANWEGISRLPYLMFNAGYSVDVISPEENFIAQSSFIENHYPVSSQIESIVEFLENHLLSCQDAYDRVIIGDDPLLYALCRISHETWVRKIIPCNSNDASIAFISSKIEFIKQVNFRGIRVPDFEICFNQNQLEYAAERLGFPIVFKKTEGFGGASVFFIENQEVLDNFKFSEPGIAQKFIEGRTVSVSALYDHGALGAYYSYYRYRTQGSFGVSTAVKFKKFLELENILKILGQISGFDGLCGVDLLEDKKSGALYLLEKNFRPTLTILIGKYVNVDFINLIKQNSNGLKFNDPIKQADKFEKIIALFPGDLLRAIGQVDFIGVARWIFLPNYWRQLCWYDFKLLRFNSKLIFNFSRDKFHRKFRSFRTRRSALDLDR